MSIESNLYEKSIKILTDLISYKTVSGQDNSELINYCEKILNELNIETFKVFDDEKKRVNLFVTLKEYDTENITLPYKKYDEQMKDDDSVESLKNNKSVVKNYLSELDTIIKHLMQNFDNCDIKKIVNYTKIYPSEMNDYNIEMNDINELNELKNESNITDDNSISNMYD